MLKSSSHFFLAISLAVTSGCIHTTNYESKSINVSPKAGSSGPVEASLTELRAGDLDVKSIVYVPDKFPLDDFFSRLRRGEFAEAFTDTDLRYHSTNTHDEGVKRLIEAGFIPAYVKLTNRGIATLSVTEKTFALDNGKNQVPAFYSNAMPNEFKKFNLKAVAANTVNFGIVVVSLVVLFYAMIYVPTKAFQGMGKGEGPGYNDGMNDVMKTTQIDYKDYLISATELKPGETIQGLLFFNFQDGMMGIHNYKLKVVQH